MDMIIHPEVLSVYCCLFCLGLQGLAKGLELSSVENKDDLWILDRFFIIFQSPLRQPGERFQFCVWQKADRFLFNLML